MHSTSVRILAIIENEIKIEATGCLNSILITWIFIILLVSLNILGNSN